jgi:hypothetical protein
MQGGMMGKKRENSQKKEKTYVCVICNKKQKSDKKVKCCGHDMLTKDKAWTD